MKISKSVYGFIIALIFLGGLILTNLLGVWEITDRDSGGGGRHSSALGIHYEVLKKG